MNQNIFFLQNKHIDIPFCKERSETFHVTVTTTLKNNYFLCHLIWSFRLHFTKKLAIKNHQHGELLVKYSHFFLYIELITSAFSENKFHSAFDLPYSTYLPHMPLKTHIKVISDTKLQTHTILNMIYCPLKLFQKNFDLLMFDLYPLPKWPKCDNSSCNIDINVTIIGHIKNAFVTRLYSYQVCAL